MANVYKRGKIWWARWYAGDGSRVAQTTGKESKREAERKAAELESKYRDTESRGGEVQRSFQRVLETAAADAAKGKLDLERAQALLHEMVQIANPSFRVVTVAEVLAGWIEDQASRVKIETLGGYKDMERRMSVALGAAVKRPVGELEKRQIEKAHVKISASVRASTSNMDLRAFRRALHWAVEQKWIKGNPAEFIKPLPEDDSEERAPFTAEEVRALLDVGYSDEWTGLILIAAHTGLRLSDVTKLSRAHVEGSRLVIRPGKTERKKKIIRVPLTPPCLAWIGEKQGGFFPGLKAQTVQTLSGRFKKIMETAGVPDKVELPGGIQAVRSFHSLRHTFASWLAEADIHADVRQKLTGHSSAGIHARYTHHDEALDRAIQVLPDLSA